MIYVDADACPVREETVRVAERHAQPVTFVSNGGIRPSRHVGETCRQVSIDSRLFDRLAAGR